MYFFSFSVLISIFKSDSPELFDGALKSIWHEQEYKPSQIVLVVDGPVSANIENVIQSWLDLLGSKLKIVRLSSNKGLGEALNVGVLSCDCELIARMDADDIAFPGRFKKQFSFLSENESVDILGTYVQEISYSGEQLALRRVPIENSSIISCLWASPMVHPSIMMRRSKVLEAGNYDPECRRRQDYELWFRCAEKGLKFHNLPEPLLYYRFGEHTHKKQPPKLAWEQAMIGFRGASRLRLPLVQRLACFLPFVRSLLPSGLQHALYRVLSPLDPRRRM